MGEEDSTRATPSSVDAFLAMHGVNKMMRPELESDARDALRQATHGDRAREDWTHVGFTVIDPRGARDHDDAVYCEASQDGWRLFVAIADVAAIVQTGDRLDEKICARGKSIYLPDETIPMCPTILTEQACSLAADEPKRALVTIIDVLPDGTTVAKESMRPAWVKIQRTITYDEAEEALARGDRELECLRACTDALRSARRAAGAIILTTPSEIPVHRDEAGEPVTGPYPERLASEGLIEEAMIATSHENAKWLLDQGARGVVYRMHPSPGRRNMEEARAAAKALLLRRSEVNDRRPFIQNILEGNRERAEWAELVARIAMEKAVYNRVPGPHFGLALACYAQTTSPIRRFGDLVAQQAAHAVHATPGSVMPIVDPRLAPWLNRCERRAFVCERYAAIEWNLRAIARVDRDRWLSGRVVSATYLGLSVEAEEIAGIHGLAHTSTLEPRDWWVLDDYATLRGGTSRETWRIGERVEIKIEAVDFAKRQLWVLVRRGASTTPRATQAASPSSD